MKSNPRSALFPAFAFACVWLAGCFTEIGNSEDEQLVEAEFKVDYSRDPQTLPKTAAGGGCDSVVIRSFPMGVTGAEYRGLDSLTDSAEAIRMWEDSSGASVDFAAANGERPLPPQSVPWLVSTQMELDGRFPAARNLQPDTLDFEAFAEAGYIKGVFYYGDVGYPFLFALPPGGKIALTYSDQALDKWYQGNAYLCRFTFFATKWMSGHTLEAAKTWPDRNGKAVTLLDADHNPAHYQELMKAFTGSFNTAQVTLVP